MRRKSDSSPTRLSPPMSDAAVSVPSSAASHGAPTRTTTILAAATMAPAAAAHAYVDSLRRKHPTASPAQLLYLLDKKFLLTLGLTGSGTGLTAVTPMRFSSALGLSAGHASAAVSAASLYLLAVAYVHGIDEEEQVVALIRHCSWGTPGGSVVEQQLGIGASTWAATALTRLPVSQVRWAHQIADRQLRRAAKRGGVSSAARLLPFGIGSVFGFISGRMWARGVIDAARQHLGPVPTTFLESGWVVDPLLPPSDNPVR